MRHGVDADHIAAIDNVVRKLMQEGKRPYAAGLFFALGHSTVVVLATLVVALGTSALQDRFVSIKAAGALIGTCVSAFFLVTIAIVNLAVLRGLWTAFQDLRRGRPCVALDTLPAAQGPLARAFRPLFRMISKSWHMFPLGMLFGLGFDTATEVALLGISATQASQGLPTIAIMIFPALFAGAMALVDTADGTLMVRAYGWAFVDPARKLCYNISVTALSVVVALLIGGFEGLGLLADKLSLTGTFWTAIAAVNDHLQLFGLIIVGLFVLSWIASVLAARWNRGDFIRQA
jgi:nickel/cobalt transporter (NiCoT) family protein